LWINRPTEYRVGLFGYIDDASISNLGVEIDNAKGGVKGSDYTGGLVGRGLNSSTIANSYAIGNVSGADNVGGLAGECYCSISNSYAAGDVSGKDYVGGLVGRANESVPVRNSVAANNSISGTTDNVNRIVGGIADGTPSNNYANNAMTVNINGSPVTRSNSDLNGAGKTLAELKTFAFYNTDLNWYGEEWNISQTAAPEYIWRINDGTSLPFFQVQEDVQQPPQAKEDGAVVAAPTLASKTTNGITVKAVVAPANGQVVEYGINTSNTAPSTWQTGLNFTGLKANTTYYIFARSKENTDYNAGTPSASLQVKTNASSSSGGGSTTPILSQVETVNHITQTANGINIAVKSNAVASIYNLKGNLIKKQTYTSGEHSISLGHLPKGMYIVRVSFGSEKYVLRVSVM